jgi:hypothetical protein
VDIGLYGYRLCLFRGDVADGGVDPLTIVVALDIGEQVGPGDIPIGVFAPVHEFGLQRAEETLHGRIVPAVCLAAHRLDDGNGLQDIAVVAGSGLTAAVEMMDETDRQAPSLDRHDERGDGEFGAHMIAHGRANDLAGEQIEDHGQVEPAFAGRDVSDIIQSDLIGPVGHKILIQQVCRHRQGMLAVGSCTGDSGVALEPRYHAGASAVRSACG